MKNLSKFLFLTALLLVFISCKKTEEPNTELTFGDFTLSKSILTPGDSIKVTYNGTDEEATAFYYYMVNNTAYPVDIDLLTDKTATIIIPDSASALAFNFKVNGDFDTNNNNGYLLPLYDKDGNPIKGNEAALAYYSVTTGKRYGIEKSKDSLVNVLANDLAANPEIKEAWGNSYLSLVYKHDKDLGKKLIEEQINTLNSKESLTEKNYMDLIFYNKLLDNTTAVDSIETIALNKFPSGKIANDNIFLQFREETDLDKRVTLYEKYSNVKKNDFRKDYMIRIIAESYLDKGNEIKFNEYSNLISNKQMLASSYNNIAWPLAEKGENLEFAGTISKKSLDLLKLLEENPSENKPSYYRTSEYLESIKNSFETYADTYALILFKQGNIKEAVNYQKLAIGEYTSPDVAERYIQFLVADKQFDVAEAKSETFIKDGIFTDKLIEFYKKAYTATKPKDTNFKTHLTELKAIAREKAIAEIKENMVDEEAPNFTLKDLDGNEVSLASLKGKTVILDFWATWCGPCIASFPSMQQAVNKYKNDPNIVFLFVNTLENGNNRTNMVSDFIEKNNYSFHVLLDETKNGSNEFKVVNQYEIDGIPTKVIIGPDGNTKYVSVGFSGAEKLAQELDILIGLLNSNKNS